MKRFSPFGLETLNVKPLAVLLPLALTLLFFVAIDSAVRFWDPCDLYDGWEDPSIALKVRSARETRARYGRIDVMLFSSSLCRQVDLGKWQEACKDQVVCFNAAVGGQRPQASRLLFEKVYYPQTKPSHVIYCISPRDVNAMGRPMSSWRHYGALWGSVNGRRLTASTLAEKLNSAVESASYLFSARGQIRRGLQKGFASLPLPEEQIGPNGVELAAVGHLQGQKLTTLDYQRILAKDSPYGHFSMPEEGEMHELVELDKFCKSHGVEFVVATFPIPPVSHGDFHNYRADYAAFHQGLEKMHSQGVKVLDMAEALKLPDEDFYDHSHTNRVGAHKVASYLYKEVIRNWFPAQACAQALPEPFVIPLYKNVSSANDAFFLRSYEAPTSPSMFQAPLQVVTRTSGGRIPLLVHVPPGNYHLDLYSHCDATSTPQKSAHQLMVEVGPETQQERLEVALQPPPKAVRKTMLMQTDLSLKTTSSLALKVGSISGTECVLDSAFLMPNCNDQGPSANVNLWAKLDQANDRALAGNLSFEHSSSRDAEYPEGWQLYTQQRQPWGKCRLVSDAHTGKHAVELKWDRKTGWGSLITQKIDPEILQKLQGQEVEVSVWAKSSGPKVHAEIRKSSQFDPKTKFSPYSQLGNWQKISTRFFLEKGTGSLFLVLGAIGSEPVMFDDVEIRPASQMAKAIP